MYINMSLKCGQPAAQQRRINSIQSMKNRQQFSQNVLAVAFTTIALLLLLLLFTYVNLSQTAKRINILENLAS